MTPTRSMEALQAFVLHDERLRRLASIARAQGRQVALVGGCVRDWLLGRQALDWDVVVEGDPMPLARALQGELGGPLVLLDAEFGVVRTRLPGGLTLDLTRMQAPTLEADLARRDLSVNALAVSLEDASLFDPTGGLADVGSLTVRALGKSNLQDDPLRLLRIYRFLATLQGRLDPQTAAWAAELAPLIEKPAGERVWAEMSKLLAHPDGGRALAGLQAAGLLAALFPSVPHEAWMPALKRHGALEALIAALQTEFGEAGRRTRALFETPLSGDRPRGSILALGVLLPSGAPLESAIVRMKLSVKEAELARLLQEASRALAGLEGASDRDLALFRAQRDFKEALPALALKALASRQVSAAFTRILLDNFWAWRDAPLKRFVSGHELLALGVKPGPRLGVLLVALEEAQAVGAVKNRDEAIAWATQRAPSGE